jgi:hypothetical protein
MDYSPFWGEWCLASLCEHLLETGHTINADVDCAVQEMCSTVNGIFGKEKG